MYWRGNFELRTKGILTDMASLSKTEYQDLAGGVVPEGITSTAKIAVSAPLIIADDVGNMLVDHNGDPIVYARAGSAI
jgi:hypothetical protein